MSKKRLPNAELETLLECPICNVKEVEPKLLSCGHSLCLKCIKDIIKSNYGQVNIKCPFCHKVSEITANGPDGLPTDLSKKQFQEIFTGKLENICDGCKKDSVNLICKNCKTQFCQKCADSHIKHKYFDTHHLVFYSDIQCKAHKKDVLYFCTSCVKLMCFMCVQDDHCNHDHQLIKIDELEKKNAVEIERIKGVRQIIKEAITHQVTVKGIKELLDSLDKTERELVSHIIELNLKLETKEKELKDQLSRRRNALQRLSEKVDGIELIDKESELTKLKEAEKVFKSGHIKEALSAMSDIMSEVDISRVTKDDQVVFHSQIVFKPINTLVVGNMKHIYTTDCPPSITTGLAFYAQTNNTTGTAIHFGDSPSTVTSTGSLFGGSGNTASKTRSVFGTPASTSTERGSMFNGSGNTASRTGSLFGVLASTSTERRSLFGGSGNTASRTGSLFGAQDSTSTEIGSLFGGSDNTAGRIGSLFGIPAHNSTERGSLFGGSSNTTSTTGFMVGPPSSASSTTTFMFGATKRSSKFGTSIGEPFTFSAPTSVFGDTPTAATPFGTVPSPNVDTTSTTTGTTSSSDPTCASGASGSILSLCFGGHHSRGKIVLSTFISLCTS